MKNISFDDYENAKAAIEKYKREMDLKVKRISGILEQILLEDGLGSNKIKFIVDHGFYWSSYSSEARWLYGFGYSDNYLIDQVIISSKKPGFWDLDDASLVNELKLVVQKAKKAARLNLAQENLKMLAPIISMLDSNGDQEYRNELSEALVAIHIAYEAIDTYCKRQAID